MLHLVTWRNFTTILELHTQEESHSQDQGKKGRFPCFGKASFWSELSFISPCKEKAAGQLLAFPGEGSEAASSPPLPLVGQVSFVPHQHDDDIAAPLCPNVIDPLGGLLERVQVCGEETEGKAKDKARFKWGRTLMKLTTPVCRCSRGVPTPHINYPQIVFRLGRKPNQLFAELVEVTYSCSHAVLQIRRQWSSTHL